MLRIKLGVWCAALAATGLLLSAGCTPPKPSEAPSKKDSHAHAHDEHPEKGPHGGPLAEWGEEEFHAEFTRDPDKKQVTVYILDGKVEKAAPIKAETIKLTLTSETPPVDIELKASPEKGEEGKSSRFVGTHDKLGQKAKLKGIIVGPKYKGDFEEK
jgi:hypothetical protein